MNPIFDKKRSTELTIELPNKKRPRLEASKSAIAEICEEISCEVTLLTKVIQDSSEAGKNLVEPLRVKTIQSLKIMTPMIAEVKDFSSYYQLIRPIVSALEVIQSHYPKQSEWTHFSTVIQQSPLDKLPSELIFEVFGFFTAQELVTLASVSKLFNEYAGCSTLSSKNSKLQSEAAEITYKYLDSIFIPYHCLIRKTAPLPKPRVKNSIIFNHVRKLSFKSSRKQPYPEKQLEIIKGFFPYLEELEIRFQVTNYNIRSLPKTLKALHIEGTLRSLLSHDGLESLTDLQTLSVKKARSTVKNDNFVISNPFLCSLPISLTDLSLCNVSAQQQVPLDLIHIAHLTNLQNLTIKSCNGKHFTNIETGVGRLRILPHIKKIDIRINGENYDFPSTFE